MKIYHCKIYDAAGTYIKVWNDATFKGFTKTINGGLGEALISLARPFADFGEDEDVKLNNEVQVWLSDKDTPAEGVKIYSGYISAYRPWIEGENQGVDVTVLGYVTKLSKDIYREPYTCLDLVKANTDSIAASDKSEYHLTTKATLECWFRTTQDDFEGGNGLIWGKLNTADYPYMLYCSGVVSTGGGSMTFGIQSASGHSYAGFQIGGAAAKATINDGNWHYVACVWDKPQMLMYLDGKLITSNAATYNEDLLATNGGLVFGRFATSACFNGQMMNIRVSNTARLANEIAHNWKTGRKLPADAGAVAVYHCDEGTGGTLDDETTQNNNATITGADWLTGLQARSTIAKTTEDPSTMLQEIITQYRTNNAAAKINYTADSIDATSTARSYIFQALFYDEIFDVIRDLAPANWYWYIGADNIVHFHLKPTTATHDFIYGKHFRKIDVFKNMEQISNGYLFKGGSDAQLIYKNYLDATSVALYERRTAKKSDSRVTDTTTADSWADSYLDEMKNPIVKTTIEIADGNYDTKGGYDIDKINPGDTCKFSNLDPVTSKTFSDNMLITKVEYAPEKAILEIESVPIDLATQIFLIQKRLNERETTDVPAFYNE